MVSLVFHGGHYKTGTTSLQHTLRHSEPALAAAGILYPRGPADGQFSDVQHADLVSDSCSGRHRPGGAIPGWRGGRRRRPRAAGPSCCRASLPPRSTGSPIASRAGPRSPSGCSIDVRYVFVVRDAIGYATSMYRELVKSGRASFHFDAVKDELATQLCVQQRSIAFFRKWDSARVTLLSFRALSADSLVAIWCARWSGSRSIPRSSPSSIPRRRRRRTSPRCC